MQPLIIAASFACAAVVAAACRGARLLTVGGAIAAALVGGAVLGFGGWRDAAALIVFFATSNLLGRWRRQRKASMGYEKGSRRDAGQVLANGGVAACLCIAAALWPRDRVPLDIAFLASIAEANADTWATEIGSASGAYSRSIATLRPSKPGQSGAISAPGTLAACAGASLIAVFSWLLVPNAPAVRGFLIAAAAGVAGCFADSLLGATIQAQYRTPGTAGSEAALSERRKPGDEIARGIDGLGNDAVNCIATAIAAAAAFALAHLA